MSTQLVKLDGVREIVSAKSGAVTNTLPSRKDFRIANGYTNAQAKREYRKRQFAFSKHASPVFNGLIADGSHVCTKITKTKKGRYTFVVGNAVEASSKYVQTPTEFAATLSAEQKAELRTLLAMEAAAGAAETIEV